MTTRPPDEPALDTAADFESALQARRRLVPRFDTLADAEPAPELDQQVLARARNALRLESTAERHYRGPRWGLPIALVATVLLSFGLVMQMDPARNDAVLPPATSMAAADATSELAAGRSRSSSTRDTEQDAPASPAAAVLAPSAPIAASLPTAPTVPTASNAASAPSAATASMAAADAPSTTTPQRSARPAAALPAERRAAADEAVEAVEAAEAMRSEAAGATRKSAPVLSTAAAPAPAPAAAAAAAAAATDAATTATAESSATASAQHAAAPLPRDDPQRWLAAIERLQQSGAIDTARTELDEFRRRYPDMPLPPALERLR